MTNRCYFTLLNFTILFSFSSSSSNTLFPLLHFSFRFPRATGCPGKWHKTLLCSPVNAVGVSRAEYQRKNEKTMEKLTWIVRK